MALLATQSVTYNPGAAPTFAAASGGGDTFTPASNQFLVIENAGGASITVTVATPGTTRGLAIADQSFTVTNGQRRYARISPADMYADPTTGLGNITYSGVTSVTVGVFQVQDN